MWPPSPTPSIIVPIHQSLARHSHSSLAQPILFASGREDAKLISNEWSTEAYSYSFLLHLHIKHGYNNVIGSFNSYLYTSILDIASLSSRISLLTIHSCQLHVRSWLGYYGLNKRTKAVLSILPWPQRKGKNPTSMRSHTLFLVPCWRVWQRVWLRHRVVSCEQKWTYSLMGLPWLYFLVALWGTWRQVWYQLKAPLHVLIWPWSSIGQLNFCDYFSLTHFSLTL